MNVEELLEELDDIINNIESDSYDYLIIIRTLRSLRDQIKIQGID